MHGERRIGISRPNPALAHSDVCRPICLLSACLPICFRVLQRPVVHGTRYLWMCGDREADVSGVACDGRSMRGMQLFLFLPVVGYVRVYLHVISVKWCLLSERKSKEKIFFDADRNDEEMDESKGKKNSDGEYNYTDDQKDEELERRSPYQPACLARAPAYYVDETAHHTCNTTE